MPSIICSVPEYREYFPSDSILSRDTGRLLVIGLNMDWDESYEKPDSERIKTDRLYQSANYDLAAIEASAKLKTLLSSLCAGSEHSGPALFHLATFERVPLWTMQMRRQIARWFPQHHHLIRTLRRSMLLDIARYLRSNEIRVDGGDLILDGISGLYLAVPAGPAFPRWH